MANVCVDCCHKKTHFVSVVPHNRNCLDSSRELTGKQQLKGSRERKQNTCYITTAILLNLHWRADSHQEFNCCRYLPLCVLSVAIHGTFIRIINKLSYCNNRCLPIPTRSTEQRVCMLFTCCCLTVSLPNICMETRTRWVGGCCWSGTTNWKLFSFFVAKTSSNREDKCQSRRRVKYLNANSLDFNAKQLWLL